MRTDKTSVRAFFFALALFFFCSLNAKLWATFYGEVKTGLQNVAQDRYGYSLFVPEEYNANQKWPLVIALPDEGERGEDYIQSWVETAKARGMIVASPNYQLPEGGTPSEHDIRLIDIKQSIENQYEVDSERILVAGYGTGGHYAFYLGLKYPKEFSAAASVGNPVVGDFKKLFKFSFAKVNQLPVLILVGDKKQTETPETTSELETFRQKGYRIEIEQTKSGKETRSPEINSGILEWFSKVITERQEANSKAGVSQKMYEQMDRLLQNR